MLAPLLNPADFQRLLATKPRWRSAHFAVHHVSASATRASGRSLPPPQPDLSTDNPTQADNPVDNYLGKAPSGLSLATGRTTSNLCWLGCVVPKRLARRAVTRNLIRRQIRSVAHQQAHRLHAGLWLIRLRAAFSADQFPSAASKALKAAARHELEQLLAA